MLQGIAPLQPLLGIFLHLEGGVEKLRTYSSPSAESDIYITMGKVDLLPPSTS